MLGPKPAYKILVIMFNYNFLVLKNAKIAIFGRLRGPNIVEKLKFFATEHFLSSVTPIRKPLNKIEKKCQMKHPRRPMSTPPPPHEKNGPAGSQDPPPPRPSMPGYIPATGWLSH